MGMDMYLFALASKPTREVDFPVYEWDDGIQKIPEQLYYMKNREDWTLWMKYIYEAKGGNLSASGNIVLLLSKEILEDLEFAVENNKLPGHERWIRNHQKSFPLSYWNAREYSLKTDREAIKKCKQALEENKHVVFAGECYNCVEEFERLVKHDETSDEGC